MVIGAVTVQLLKVITIICILFNELVLNLGSVMVHAQLSGFRIGVGNK